MSDKTLPVIIIVVIALMFFSGQQFSAVDIHDIERSHFFMYEGVVNNIMPLLTQTETCGASVAFAAVALFNIPAGIEFDEGKSYASVTAVTGNKAGTVVKTQIVASDIVRARDEHLNAQGFFITKNDVGSVIAEGYTGAKCTITYHIEYRAAGTGPSAIDTSVYRFDDHVMGECLIFEGVTWKKISEQTGQSTVTGQTSNFFPDYGYRKAACPSQSFVIPGGNRIPFVSDIIDFIAGLLNALRF